MSSSPKRPTCAPTTWPGTPVLAFQRIASAHQAETYCQDCGAAHDACLSVDPDGDPVVGICPSCGAQALILIDAFTAGLVVQIHAALSPENRVRLEKFDVLLIATICLKLSKKGK